jgi:hypothetical protein
MCLLHVSSIFRKISPKTFGPHSVCAVLCCVCVCVCRFSKYFMNAMLLLLNPSFIILTPYNQ